MIQNIRGRYIETVPNPEKTTLTLAWINAVAFLVNFFLFLPVFTVDHVSLTGEVLVAIYSAINAAITVACLFGLITGIYGGLRTLRSCRNKQRLICLLQSFSGAVVNGGLTAIGLIMMVDQFIH